MSGARGGAKVTAWCLSAVWVVSLFAPNRAVSQQLARGSWACIDEASFRKFHARIASHDTIGLLTSSLGHCLSVAGPESVTIVSRLPGGVGVHLVERGLPSPSVWYADTSALFPGVTPQAHFLSADQIEAIAGLWRLAAVLLVALVVILFRKPLVDLIRDIKQLRVKSGNTELSAERAKALEPASATESPVTAEPKVERASAQAATEKPPESFFEVIQAMRAKNEVEGKAIFGRVQEREKDPAERLRNDVLFAVFQFQYLGDTKALERIEAIATDNPGQRSYALRWLGIQYRRVGEFKTALEVLNRARQAAQTPSDRASALEEAADTLVAQGTPAEGASLLVTGLADPDLGAADKARLFTSMAGAQKALGNHVLRSLALEKAAEYSGLSTSARFDAAFQQATAGWTRVAAVNYDALLKVDGDSLYALNNLGVELQTLGLIGRSISQLKKAAEKGLPLAMANLAFRYLEQGFNAEAKDILARTKDAKDLPARVGEALKAVSAQKEEESQKWNAIMAEGVRQQGFLRDLGDVWFAVPEEAVQWDGKWTAEGGQVLDVECEGTKLTAEWLDNEDKWRFVGVSQGRAAQGEINKWRVSLFSQTSGTWDSVGNAFALVSPDASEVRIVKLEGEDSIYLLAKKNVG